MGELTKIQTSRLKTEEVTNAVSGRVLDDKITNCITEIPQDIKLELVDGTLTLKSSSKVYVPNGVGKFDEVIISGDKSLTYTYNNPCVVWYDNTANILRIFPQAICFSGNTAPTFSGNFAFWYDTTNNKCKFTGDAGSYWTETQSLPICIVTVLNDAISSIDQVFNGFGYIGSTVFALPGVKGLIPNGRNEDGSLKNIEFETSKVATYTSTTSFTGEAYLCLNSSSVDRLRSTTFYHDTLANLNKDTNGTKIYYCFCGLVSLSNDIITTFNPKNTFHTVDYNDFKQLNDETVKLIGNQTIEGLTTFTNIINRRGAFSNSGPTLLRGIDTNYKGETQLISYYVGNTIYNRLLAINNTSGKNGYFEVTAKDDGTSTISLGGSATTKSVTFNSATHVLVPTPTSATDNSTNAATTAWCTKASQEGNLFGAPNYSAGVSKTTNTTYTAEKNGWLMFIRAYADRGGASSTLTIGGISMVFRNKADIEGDAYMFPIGKGQTYSFTGETLTFYPCL